VTLPFEGADSIISAFFNSAVGKLLGEFPEERIRELLSVQDATPSEIW
jgi:hypothetical protein